MTSEPASSKPTESREQVYFFRFIFHHATGDFRVEFGVSATNETEARTKAQRINGAHHTIHELVAVTDWTQP